ncbi:MAG: retropepsin-like aspartic protease family protein [Nitrospinota bacterium]
MNKNIDLNILLGLFPFLLLASIPTLSFSKESTIYKWEEKDGVQQFSDQKPLETTVEKNKLEILNYDGKKSDSPNKPGYKPNLNRVENVDSTITPEESTTIPLVRTNQSYFVNISINDQPKQLLLDTGASLTVISTKIAKSLGIKELKDLPRIPVSTAAGGSFIYLVTFKSIKIGNLELENVEGGISTELGGNIDGLLGGSFLNNFIYQIDSNKSQLILKSSFKTGKLYGGKNKDYWTKNFEELAGRIKYYKKIEAVKRNGYNDQQIGELASYSDYTPSDIRTIISYYETELNRLENKASKEGVPISWRAGP